MSKEAMKLALEALKTAEDFDIDADDGYYLKAINALEEALAKQEQGEPVAWMRKDEVKAMTDIEKQAWTASQQGVDGYWSEVVKDYSIPLYTTPQTKQEQGEPFGWYDMEHGEIRDVEWNRLKPTYEGVWRPLYTTPQQRTWVHLTNQEHDEIAIECGCLSADWVFYGAALERKIKDKNT